MVFTKSFDYELVTFFLLFSSPIFYPLAIIPQEVQKFLILNPLLPIIESIRQISLSGNFPDSSLIFHSFIFYGVMLGFSRQGMKERAKLILEFAELEDYALVPVKGLSSGMAARLGFAIATDIEPDILILDEVLSVGDESFKNKCQQRMDSFWQDHVTILLVSHSMALIKQACQKVIWMEKGRVKLIGQAPEVVDAYLGSIAK